MESSGEELGKLVRSIMAAFERLLSFSSYLQYMFCNKGFTLSEI